jgi:hypothetical protein
MRRDFMIEAEYNYSFPTLHKPFIEVGQPPHCGATLAKLMLPADFLMTFF